MEYGCYICNKIIKTGEKFTFTKEGPVHMDCFVAADESISIGYGGISIVSEATGMKLLVKRINK